MVNREVRRRAAEFVRKFRDQQITNDQFEDNFYPLMHEARQDPALKAIGTMIWTLYGDSREHVLNNGRPVREDVCAMLDRCVRFLESDAEYAWDRERFTGVWGITNVWRKLVRSRAQPGRHAGPDTDADFAVWPFLPGDSGADRA